MHYEMMYSRKLLGLIDVDGGVVRDAVDAVVGIQVLVHRDLEH
jgi:hypothetical protein